jgi:alpha-beta hydrolase superfamily lysophospholipase
MKIVAIALAALALIALAALAGTIAFSAPADIAPMASVENAFEDTDFSDMPEKKRYAARDGAMLAYRAYPGDPLRVVVLVHGSSGTTASMHPLARAIHAAGATVYTVAMRGHDGTGRSGDIDYIGQLDDDLADFVKMLGPRNKGEVRTLLGFSSGGGFALRFAGGTNRTLFDRLILIAPQFPHDAPTVRQDAGGWVSVAIPRYAALLLLNKMGIHWFDGLSTLRMAVDPKRAAETGQTGVYSFRMMRNFGPGNDYLGDFTRFKGPVTLLAGSADEIFIASRFAPVVHGARRDVRVELVPGINHMGMTTKAAALAAIVAAAR